MWRVTNPLPCPYAEDNTKHGMCTPITYFVLHNKDLSAFVCRSTNTNTGNNALTFAAPKGLAKIWTYDDRRGWGLRSIKWRVNPASTLSCCRVEREL